MFANVDETSAAPKSIAKIINVCNGVQNKPRGLIQLDLDFVMEMFIHPPSWFKEILEVCA